MSRTEYHWIFFYGSCISSASRKATGITGAVFPCSVSGYTRHWGARVDLAAKGLVVNDEITGVTAVTCLAGQRQNMSTNGVLVRVPGSSIPSFDQREVNYTRKRVARNNIKPMRSTEEDKAISTFAAEPEAPCWM